jgi:hypothetical protein
MTRPRFTITVGGRTAVAELLDDAPAIARTFWEHLDLDSFAIHAKFAGGELIVMVPFMAESENEVLDVQPGDIGYFPDMQTICLFYGEVTPFGEVSVFARVVDGLEQMQRAGADLLTAPSAPAQLRRAATPHEPGAYASATPGAEINAAGMSTAAMSAALAAIWADQPADIARLRDSSLPPGGRWSGVLLCNVLLLWNGQILMSLRALARDRTVGPAALAAVLAAQCAAVADWVAHWNMHDLEQVMRSAAGRLSSPVDAAELEKLLDELILVTNRVQNWIDSFTPWAQLDQLLPALDGPAGSRRDG